jgi:putative FmdB family regulatory protein
MPIFEYQCRQCSSSFELLVRSGTAVECPSCSSANVVKKLSIFAAHSRHADKALPPCHTGGEGCDLGRCGSGMCGVG